MTTFHPFPRLPAELRYAVWELTLEPREVVIKTHYQPESPGGENPNIITSFYSPTTIPSALHTCQDSRALFVSRYYTRAFTNGITPHYIWADFASDTIRIADDNLLDLIVLPDPLAIRFLTIDCPAHSLRERGDPAFTTCTAKLRNLSTLERVSIVCVLYYHAARTAGLTCCDKWTHFLDHFTSQFVFPEDCDKSLKTFPVWTMRFADRDYQRPNTTRSGFRPYQAWTIRFADTWEQDLSYENREAAATYFATLAWLDRCVPTPHPLTAPNQHTTT